MFESIAVLWGMAMLFSCNNNIKEVNEFLSASSLPLLSGDGLELVYSDSAKVRYILRTPEYFKYKKEREEYDEFPSGLYAESFNPNGELVGTISCKYAKKNEEDRIWTLKDQVVVRNPDGKKLETELLFWDMEKATIYSDRYVRLTDKGQVIEGNGFESDQDICNPKFKNISGTLEIEMRK